MERNRLQEKTTTKKNELKKMLLKSKWVTKLIEEEILKNMELNENEDETIQSLQDATSGVL